MKRAKFLRQILATSALPLLAPAVDVFGQGNQSRSLPGEINIGDKSARHLKLSLNAYSFNDPLMKGTVSHEQLLQFCAKEGFEGLDMTGYYFTGYPKVPTDDSIYSLKRKAHSLGISISGTGVRNDFTNDDPKTRQDHVKLVNDWLEVASKLGAPVLRIFAGNQYPPPDKRETYMKMLMDSLGQCLAKAKSYGIILGIQNHHDFIRTSDEAIEILKAINSEWLGLILDTGSYRGPDPYQDIARSIPYAVNWQIKENIFINNVEQPTDLDRLFKIISNSDYRGYIPIETLGPGETFEKVARFAKAVILAKSKYGL